jgi:hypothetical protein
MIIGDVMPKLGSGVSFLKTSWKSYYWSSFFEIPPEFSIAESHCDFPLLRK